MRTALTLALATPLLIAATSFPIDDVLGSRGATHAGPPWISIEYPVNPHDRSTRDAFLVVHAYHHGTPVAFPVSGTAEGLVGGERRTLPLSFERTSRTGAFALKKSWPSTGTWTLAIAVTQGSGDKAWAVVELGDGGEVASVRVPTRTRDGWTIPTEVSMQEIDRGLRSRASQLTRR